MVSFSASLIVAEHKLICPERYYIDPGESIRFRVDSVEWNDIRPAPPPQYNAAGDLESSQPEKDPIDKAGFKIFVSDLPTIRVIGLRLMR